jgi:hypothetical protein
VCASGWPWRSTLPCADPKKTHHIVRLPSPPLSPILGCQEAYALEKELNLPAYVSAKARLDAFYDALMAASEDTDLDEDKLEELAMLVPQLRLERAQMRRLSVETAACDPLVNRVRALAETPEARRRIDGFRDILLGRK